MVESDYSLPDWSFKEGEEYKIIANDVGNDCEESIGVTTVADPDTGEAKTVNAKDSEKCKMF